VLQTNPHVRVLNGTFSANESKKTEIVFTDEEKWTGVFRNGYAGVEFLTVVLAESEE